MTCPDRIIDIEAMLFAFIPIFAFGWLGGLWLGFKLWRVTYIRGIGYRADHNLNMRNHDMQATRYRRP